MQVLDASSVVHAWDNYPIRQIPGLWEWMAEQIEEENLVIPRVAFEEVENKVPECAGWLKSQGIKQLEVNNAVLQSAMHIKNLLGIVDDKYHKKGVGENDILIIAMARENRGELVTEEGRQTVPPDIPAKRKIPAVCNLREVSVPCINFVEFFKRSERVFR